MLGHTSKVEVLTHPIVQHRAARTTYKRTHSGLGIGRFCCHSCRYWRILIGVSFVSQTSRRIPPNMTPGPPLASPRGSSKSAIGHIIGRGEMADRVRAYDWASTPLGP